MDFQKTHLAPLLLMLSVFFSLPLFAGQWEEAPVKQKQLFRYNEEPTPITYGGMTIQCYGRCGEPTTDPSAARAIPAFKEATRQISDSLRPLCLGQSLVYCVWDWGWDSNSNRSVSVYDWVAAGGFCLEEIPRQMYSIRTHPEFLELASVLRRDLQFYCLDVHYQRLSLYRSTIPLLERIKKEGKYGNVAFYKDGSLQLCPFIPWSLLDDREPTTPIWHFISNLKEDIPSLEEKLSDFYPRNYEKKKEQAEEAIRTMDLEFRNIFHWCLNHHQTEGIAFHAAVEDFLGGDFDLAIDQIRWMIDAVEKQKAGNELLSKLYLLKGELQSEFGLYADAIVALTTAIQKNPSMKEAYFERAVAYFELGKFEKAIEDFLVSDVHSRTIESPTQLGLGISTGILLGAGEWTIEFIPSLFRTASGLSSGLWAFCKSPLGATQDVANAAVKCYEYLKTHTPIEIVQTMVPELKELIQNYDQLADFEKGQLMGLIVGKYGTGILLAKGATEYAKLYRNLKKASQVMTLEALAAPPTTQTIITETGKHWAIREETLRNANLQIHKGKQGKHLESHSNYKDLVKRNENPSLFEHSEPERLVQKYAGTGIKDAGTTPGMSGYVEIVDFEEFIGYNVELKTGKRMPTTRGKIHYAKDGIHIVPTIPKEK